MRSKRILHFVLLSSIFVLYGLGNSACRDRHNTDNTPFGLNNPLFFTPGNPLFNSFIIQQQINQANANAS